MQHYIPTTDTVQQLLFNYSLLYGISGDKSN